MPIDDHEQNRLSWNAATERHNLHKGDQAKFFREGGTTIYPEDVGLIGEADGKTLLHLQCNAGQDSLSIARDLGAEVTGVDISDYAIDFGKKLSADSGIAANFERADIFDWCECAGAPLFDLVYTSYGTICWLSDLERWGRCVAGRLKPGGRFVIIEFHPLLFALDENDPERLHYDYLGGGLIDDPEGVNDYVGLSGGGLSLDNSTPATLPAFENPHGAKEYAWGLGETVSALTAAGLQIESLVEYPYSNGWKPFATMRDLPGNRKAMPEGSPILPLMFSITASKAG